MIKYEYLNKYNRTCITTFCNLNSLKTFEAKRHHINESQVIIKGNEVALTNKLGVVFAYVGEIVNL